MLPENDVIVFSAPDRGGFSVNIKTGEVDLFPDIDPIYWTNYVVSALTGVAAGLEELGHKGILNGTIGINLLAMTMNIAAIASESENASTSREAIQIVAVGIADLARGYATGWLVGYLLATAPVGAAAVWPVVVGLVVLGAIEYFVGNELNKFLETLVKWASGEIYDRVELIYDVFNSPLLNIKRDPLVLDLDGDGVELTALTNSNVHFDFDKDGFAEKTGWVSSDDGILVRDINGNGRVDDAGELFGSPNQDGFAVLETLDSNGDGKIDSGDENFSQLRVWRDLNQNGQADNGEMVTLTEAGIASLSLIRTDVAGTNEGHTIGYEALFTRIDGTVGTTQTIYFETDRQDTQSTDNTPDFTAAETVLKLPQLPGSGQINSIAWKATEDAGFRSAWTALTDEAANLSPSELRGRFIELILEWAGVDGVNESSRGQYVNGQHLAFVERFFGNTYQEIYAGQGITTSPSTVGFGATIEASFNNIVDLMLTAFLSQVGASVVVRGGDIEAAISSPYFAYALLDFSKAESDETPTFGNVGHVVELIAELAPEDAGAASEFVVKALGGLEGMVAVAFGGDRDQYWATVQPSLSDVSDATLKQIATLILKGEAVFGSSVADGLIKFDGDNLFDGGKGDDVIVSDGGSDLFVYRKGDGSDLIRDMSKSKTEVDTLVLTDLNAADVTFERVGDTLRIKIAGTSETIISENFFYNWDSEHRGIDKIRFADGTELSRDEIGEQSTTVGDENNNAIYDTAGDDVLRAGAGDDQITISDGRDTILYAVGDGNDVIIDTSGLASEPDTLELMGLNPDDIELSRLGQDLVVLIKSSGEEIVSADFFRTTSTGVIGGWGIDKIKFQGGLSWDKATIASEAWIRGDDKANGLTGDVTDDTLAGGKGNDILNGGQGSDTYIWSIGDGKDAIIEMSNDMQGVDSLHLSGIRSGDVELFRRGTSLVVSIKSTGETVEISDQFYNVGNINEDWNQFGFGVEEIIFDNGTRWGREFLMKNTVTPGFDFDVESMVVNGAIIYHYFTDELGAQGNIYTAVWQYEYLFGQHDIVIGGDAGDRIGDGAASVVDVDPITGLLVWRATNDGHNVFDGGKGTDLLIGGDGHDALIGGEGNDTIYGDDKSESGDAGSGHDVLEGGDGDDDLYGGGGNDLLNGGAGEDLLAGGDGADALEDAGPGNDTFVGGRGSDLIVSSRYSGNSGSDLFIYASGDGHDQIIDLSTSASEVDVLKFTDIVQSDVLLSYVKGDLTIRILSTGETIYVSGFFDKQSGLTASIGIDRIEFANGLSWDRAEIEQKAWVRGTDGREILQNSSLIDNTFLGKKGDDVIISAITRGLANTEDHNGDDTFIYASGDGNDVIFDGSHSKTETDTLILTDLNTEDVRLSRNGIDLRIKDMRTGQVIVNEGFFWNWDTTGQGIDAIEFADGTTWNRDEMRDNAWVWGSVAKDYLKADEAYDNVFVGGRGDDILQSAYTRGSGNSGQANGNDRFLYKLGDGNDIIFDGSHSRAEKDRLVLEDINAEDLRLSVNGLDLIIKILPSGHQITDEGAMWNRQGVGQGLDEIQFADGTIWSREDIRYWAEEGSLFYAGTSGNDRLIGSYLDQRLSGGDGGDFIDGGAGSDLVFGDRGDDTLAMTVANPTDLDRLDGGADNDTVTFENFSTSIFVDLVLNDGEARTSDTSSHSAVDDRLVATLTDLENVVGTAFADRISGDDAANALHGNAGDDNLDGRSGSDSLYGGAGHDSLVGYLGDDLLDGGAGDDELDGGLGSDTYVYSAGDGDDVLTELSTGGVDDIIRLKGVSAADVSFVRSGTNVSLKIAEGTLGSITLVGTPDTPRHFDEYGIEKIVFDNGTTWDANFLRQWSIYAAATGGNDSLTGTSASGDFGGGAGDDTLNGGGGNDAYIYARGDGNDTITEDVSNGESDKIIFSDLAPTDVILIRSGNDILVVIAESAPGADDAGSILIKNTINGTNESGIERLMFADGTIWDKDRILDELQAGVATDDIINGTSADDTFRYFRGDGNDTFNDAGWGGYNDQLVFADINPQDVTLVRDGNDVTLVIAETTPGAGDGGSVRLNGTLSNSTGWGVDKVVFADANVWTAADLRNMLLTSTAADETLAGFGTDDTFRYSRGDGNDILNEDGWGGYNDQLVFADINPQDVTLVRDGNDVTLVIAETTPGAGDGGSVRLNGTLSNSTGWGVDKVVFADATVWTPADLRNMLLTSTTADETLAGFGTDDTFRYSRGDGNDILNEAGWGGYNDQLVFADINPQDVTLVRDGNDVTLVIAETTPGAGDGGSVRLNGTLSNSTGWGVDKVVFANGTVWDHTAILAELESSSAAAMSMQKGANADLLLFKHMKSIDRNLVQKHFSFEIGASTKVGLLAATVDNSDSWLVEGARLGQIEFVERGDIFAFV